MKGTKKSNKNLMKIVSILNGGLFHDGTTMGAELQMTRSAIWKVIKKLQNYGVKVESVKGKGYALPEPLMLLDVQEIEKRITAACKEKVELHLFEAMSSTNDYLKTFKNEKTIKICLTEMQTQGRGRFGRHWHSPFGKNIYLSCHYLFQKDVSELSGLSMVTTLAIVETLKSYGINDHLHVKWPNDIVYAQQKLSGSLIEIQAETHGVSHAVIGIGMNVNMREDEGEISQAWTSMQQILNQYVDRNELVSRLLVNLLSYLQRFNACGFSPFIDEWVKNDCLSDQQIVLHHLNKKIEGKVTGISEQGHLLLQLANGDTGAFSSGDTSMREFP